MRPISLYVLLLMLSALLISGNTQALPTATVDVTFPFPAPHYTDDRVILRCDISEYEDWTYIWSINGQEYRYCRTGSSTCYFILGHDNTLGLDTVKYSCKGTRSGQPQFSQQSPDVSITVTALPTTAVKILSPPAPRYPGETVILQCDISQYEDWSNYFWFIDGNRYKDCTNKTCSIKLGNHGFRQSCFGGRSGRPQNSQSSPTSSLPVTDLPTPTLTVTPNPVYHGETVSLKCSVESDPAWSYRWSKGRSEITGETSGRHRTSGDFLTISEVEQSDEGRYQCSGELRDIPPIGTHSQYLNVYDLPTATVNILSPPAPRYPGDTVTLQCDISQYEDWSYMWFINGNLYGQCTNKTCSINLIKSNDQFSCSGRRGGRPQNSQSSPTSSVLLTDLPTPTLTVTLNPVYHGETVSLKCSVESGAAWSYRWFKDKPEITGETSGRHRISGDILTISKVEQLDEGHYWCRAEIPSRSISSALSSSIAMTVRDDPVTLESPVHPVTVGDSVTLRCRHKTSPSNSKVDFYKDGNLIKKETTGEMTIPAVSLSDQGLYKCSYSNREESPPSWLLVRGITIPVQGVSIVNKLLYGFLGIFVFLAITILVFLLIKRLQRVKTAEEEEGADVITRRARDRSHDDTGL